MRKYSHVETIIANIPYAAMVFIGAVTIAYAYGFSPPALAGAGGYLAYGIAGALWIILFVCPYCTYYGSQNCPCGYGTLSSKLTKRGDRSCFGEKFRRHIPVIVPLWLIPVACGALALWSSFSWWLVGFVFAFVIESWVILPLVSRRHGCIECPQKKQCPWMTSGVLQ